MSKICEADYEKGRAIISLSRLHNVFEIIVTACKLSKYSSQVLLEILGFLCEIHNAHNFGTGSTSFVIDWEIM